MISKVDEYCIVEHQNPTFFDISCIIDEDTLIDINLDATSPQIMPSYVRGKRTNQVSIPSNSTDEVVLNTLRKHVSTPIKNLKIPPFAATNSLFQNDIDTSL